MPPLISRLLASRSADKPISLFDRRSARLQDCFVATAGREGASRAAAGIYFSYSSVSGNERCIEGVSDT